LFILRVKTWVRGSSRGRFDWVQI